MAPPQPPLLRWATERRATLLQTMPLQMLLLLLLSKAAVCRHSCHRKTWLADG
jgi:hypothetical protein